MATVRRTRRKTEKVASSATVVRLRGRTAAGKDVVHSFAGAVAQELRAKHTAGLPYSTLNDRGEVVFVHPDGTIRTGRAGDLPGGFLIPPWFWIVAGPNGSGKTTLVRSGALAGLTGPLPDLALNPDDIARSLREQMPAAMELAVVRQAQAESDGRVDQAIQARRSLLVETVLSSDKFRPRVTAGAERGISVRAGVRHLAGGGPECRPRRRSGDRGRARCANRPDIVAASAVPRRLRLVRRPGGSGPADRQHGWSDLATDGTGPGCREVSWPARLAGTPSGTASRPDGFTVKPSMGSAGRRPV